MTESVEKIAKRHMARCLSRIEEVHELPEVCAAEIRSEMHYCAEDVAALVLSALKQGVSDDEDTRYNR